MNYELIVLKSFLDRLTYDKYRSAINLSFTRQNAPEIHVLFTVLDQVYSSTEVAALTVGELEALTFSEFPYLKPVEQEVYRDLFKRLEEIECHPDLVERSSLKQNNVMLRTRLRWPRLKLLKADVSMPRSWKRLTLRQRARLFRLAMNLKYSSRRI